MIAAKIAFHELREILDQNAFVFVKLSEVLQVPVNRAYGKTTESSVKWLMNNGFHYEFHTSWLATFGIQETSLGRN